MHRGDAHKILSGFCIGRVHDDGLQVVVRDGKRRAAHPAYVKRRHLQLGEGAAHAVRIDQREPQPGRRHDGQQRIQAADLESDQGIGCAAQPLFEAPHCQVDIVSAGGFLAEHGRHA